MGVGQSTSKLRPPHTKFLELEPVPNHSLPFPASKRARTFNCPPRPVDGSAQSQISVDTSQLRGRRQPISTTAMICRRCLQRAAALRTPRAAPSTSVSWSLPIRNGSRPISSTATRPSAATTAPASTTTPPLSTPLADSEGGAAAAAAAKESLSSCPEGTILTGLNYFKNKTDPAALADDAYPEWLWKCLEVQQKTDEGEADDAGDEFSKSKKQRRLAAKRQRTLEAKLMAEGNLEALAPKIPLQHQAINLPANESGTTEGAVAAHDAREELRRAMRRERKAKIKESNYLKSM
ncbi:mitochondrial ribosomal protein L37-domain-containing protein [Xylaria longipes]|nr:mitochondrial ribosomal protein L37-domain-containing protein [Xylaria longipes]